MTTTLKRLRHGEIQPSPNNPRGSAGDIDGLADSIAGVGLLQPMVVRKSGDVYELIAGERRWTAIGKLIDEDRVAEDASWDCMVHTKVDDATQQVGMIVENLHRQNLSHEEEFNGIVTLASTHAWTAEQIATQTGISIKSVKDRMAWMAFTDEQLAALFDKDIPVDSMTQLAKLPAAEISEAFVKKAQLRYEIDNVLRMSGRRKEAKRFVNKLRKAGHLVCDYDDKDTDAAAAALKTLEARCGDDEKMTVLHSNLRAVEERFDEIDAGSIFFVKVMPYAVEVKRAVVQSTAPRNGDTPETAATDYRRDTLQAQVDFEREQAAYKAQRTEAERSFLYDSKPSELVSYVLMQTLLDVGGLHPDDDEWDDKHLAEMLNLGDDTPLKVHITKNAGNLVQAAVAVLLIASGDNVPGFDLESPMKAWPSRHEYDDNEKYVGPASDEAALDGHEPPDPDSFDTDEEYSAALEVFETHKQMLEEEADS